MSYTIFSILNNLFREMADYLELFLPKWPLLIIVHCIVTAITLRKERGGYQLAHSHPIASCVSNVIITMSGMIITDLIFGRPILTAITNEKIVISSIVAWYLINFSPYDITYKFFKYRIIKYIIYILEEIYRSRKVMTGVLTAAKVFPNSILAMGMAGMLRSSGKKWNISLYRLLLGAETNVQIELLNPTFATKAGFLLGIFYALSHTYNLFRLTDNQCVMIGAVIFAVLQFWKLWFRVKKADPLQRVQGAVWSVMQYGAKLGESKMGGKESIDDAKKEE